MMIPAAATTASPILGSGSDTTMYTLSQLDPLFNVSPGCNQLKNPGGTQQFDFSCSPAITTQNGDVASGSNTVSNIPDVSAIKTGYMVTGAGIPTNTFVGTVTVTTPPCVAPCPGSITLSSSNTQNISVNATSTHAGTALNYSLDLSVTENYAHDQATSAYFLGSGNGRAQLCGKGTAGFAPIDYARSSALPGTPECTGLKFVGFARDGISWEAFNIAGSGINNGGLLMSNGTGSCAGTGGTTKRYCMTQQQIKQIYGVFTCDSNPATPNHRIANWSDVGGGNVPIVVYTPQDGSGTRSTWDTFLGGTNKSVSCDGVTDPFTGNPVTIKRIPENSNYSILSSDKSGAIFPFSYGLWNSQVKAHLTLAQNTGAVFGVVDGIVASATSLQDNATIPFPYSRWIYNVYCSATDKNGAASTCAATAGPSSAATVNYVGETGWLCKPPKGTVDPNATPINWPSGHTVDPVTGKNYAAEITATITTGGFVQPKLAAVHGPGTPLSYCRLVSTS
jgi:hypothetical protein